jgi:hypothetical protein
MTSTTSVPAPGKLRWQSHGEFQIATDGTRFLMRESTGAIIAALIATVVLGFGSGVYGVWLVFTAPEASYYVFAAMLLLVSAVFITVFVSSFRRGRWNVAYERGQPGVPAEIRFCGKSLPAERVRAFSTRCVGGRMPRYVVVAELHEGGYEIAGPITISTWADQYGQQAANWLNLPFRRHS